MEEHVFVFVYGTLKRKYWNHDILGKSRFIGEGVTNEQFTMFDGGFPWVSNGFNDEKYLGQVIGELYEVTSKNVLDNLDRLEGVPYMYVRRDVNVTCLNGSVFPAIMYVASDGSNERLNQQVPMEPKGRGRYLEWKN